MRRATAILISICETNKVIFFFGKCNIFVIYMGYLTMF